MISVARLAVSHLECIHVEVAYAEPDRQFLRTVELRQGATAADAIRVSNVEAECVIEASELRIGIWSKAVEPGTVLNDGDRIEIYRPLKIDPKEARRKRANKRIDKAI